MEYPVCSTYVRSRVVVVVVVAVVVAVALNSMRVRVRVREKTRAEKLGVTIASAGFRKKMSYLFHASGLFRVTPKSSRAVRVNSALPTRIFSHLFVSDSSPLYVAKSG